MQPSEDEDPEFTGLPNSNNHVAVSLMTPRLKILFRKIRWLFLLDISGLSVILTGRNTPG